jgi:capsular polysaccharide export protein
MPTRRFLLLQGPIGPFFRMLGEGLVARGHVVHKVNFCGGDVSFSPAGTRFSGTETEWPGFLMRVCTRNDITDVVLFGDRRNLHEMAIEVISETFPDMRIWVFEEGYFRPHWVTMDHWGVNARSSFPSSRAELMAAVEAVEKVREPGSEAILPWFKEFAPVAVRYYAAMRGMEAAFPHFEYHRVATPVTELMGWAKSWGARLLMNSDPAERQRFLARSPGRHFVTALQLEGDYQIRRYSPFSKNQQVIEHVLQSFAKNSRDSDVLVFKPHPYDYDWMRWQALAKSHARTLGIENRVMVITRCSPAEVLTGCSGFLTINSTFALKAMELGIPVKALGQAFWNYAPLTHEGSLEGFWNQPAAGDPKFFALFRSYLMSQTQYNGGFYSEQGRRLCLREVLPVLERGEQDTQRLHRDPLQRLRERRQHKLKSSGLSSQPKKKLDMQL